MPVPAAVAGVHVDKLSATSARISWAASPGTTAYDVVSGRLSTMVTLQQIYDKLGAPGPVGRTGQAGCWDANGVPISCAGTGEDGALVKGVTVSPRFTDNADGTVKDDLTGLVWLKNANCFGLQQWTTAFSNWRA